MQRISAIPVPRHKEPVFHNRCTEALTGKSRCHKANELSTNTNLVPSIRRDPVRIARRDHTRRNPFQRLRGQRSGLNVILTPPDSVIASHNFPFQFIDLIRKNGNPLSSDMNPFLHILTNASINPVLRFLQTDSIAFFSISPIME